MSRMGVNCSRMFVLFSVYQLLFGDAAGLQSCLHCTSRDSAFTGSWCFVDDFCAGGAERLCSPTGVCPILAVTDNALITKPKAGDVCLLGPEGS